MAEHFGGISLAEIAEAAGQPLPEIAGATPTERFVLKISALVTLRQQQGECGGVAVFLQSDALGSDAKGCASALFKPFISNGNDPIASTVWLSNANLGGAYALNIDCANQEAIFAAVQEAGFGSLPALVIDWRGAVPVGMLYSRGIANLEAVSDVALAYSEINDADLKACLDRFHQTSLATPLRTREGHAEAVWSDASKGWPANRPEERIQAKLIEHLRSRFTKHNVRAERKNDDGITDLIIFANTTDVSGQKVVVKEWVLELKALTDRTISGAVVPAPDAKRRVEEGVTQAVAYRDREHARKAALCCYDMRASDEGDTVIFADIKDEAEREGIRLWRWFLFRSSQASRNSQRAERNSAAAQG